MLYTQRLERDLTANDIFLSRRSVAFAAAVGIWQVAERSGINQCRSGILSCTNFRIISG